MNRFCLKWFSHNNFLTACRRVIHPRQRDKLAAEKRKKIARTRKFTFLFVSQHHRFGWAERKYQRCAVLCRCLSWEFLSSSSTISYDRKWNIQDTLTKATYPSPLLSLPTPVRLHPWAYDAALPRQFSCSAARHSLLRLIRSWRLWIWNLENFLSWDSTQRKGWLYSTIGFEKND